MCVCVCVCVCVCEGGFVSAWYFTLPCPLFPDVFQNPVSSQELKVLRDRERALQENLLTAQKENLTLRLDCEQATVDLPRLKVC